MTDTQDKIHLFYEIIKKNTLNSERKKNILEVNSASIYILARSEPITKQDATMSQSRIIPNKYTTIHASHLRPFHSYNTNWVPFRLETPQLSPFPISFHTNLLRSRTDRKYISSKLSFDKNHSAHTNYSNFGRQTFCLKAIRNK